MNIYDEKEKGYCDGDEVVLMERPLAPEVAQLGTRKKAPELVILNPAIVNLLFRESVTW